MIQIVFTDNGKVHTVTFSGDKMERWADKFTAILDAALLTYEWRII